MDFDIYSDIFKEACGFRPRGVLAEEFLNASPERQEEMFRQVKAASEAAQREEDARHKASIVRLETRITDLIGQGAGDRATALRWIAEAEDAGNDTGYLEFLLDVPYGYLSPS